MFSRYERAIADQKFVPNPMNPRAYYGSFAHHADLQHALFDALCAKLYSLGPVTDDMISDARITADDQAFKILCRFGPPSE
jgi:hypothetical protein